MGSLVEPGRSLVSWQGNKTQSRFNFLRKTALMLETNITMCHPESHLFIYLFIAHTYIHTYIQQVFKGPKSLVCFVFSLLPWILFFYNTGIVTALVIRVGQQKHKRVMDLFLNLDTTGTALSSVKAGASVKYAASQHTGSPPKGNSDKSSWPCILASDAIGTSTAGLARILAKELIQSQNWNVVIPSTSVFLSSYPLNKTITMALLLP